MKMEPRKKNNPGPKNSSIIGLVNRRENASKVILQIILMVLVENCGKFLDNDFGPFTRNSAHSEYTASQP